MKRNILYHTKQVLIVTIAVTMLVLAACASATTSTNTPTFTPTQSPGNPPTQTPTPPPGQTTTAAPANLAFLQQSGHLTVILSARMTFSSSGALVPYPTVFDAPSVPITWSGASFTGELEKIFMREDTAEYTIYRVNGTASADGSTLLSLVYSRQIVGENSNPRNFYQVSLQNMPIAKGAGGAATELATFDVAGADAQKYVRKIEYADALNSGGLPNTVYVSTDWSGTTPVPTLKVAFGK